MSRTTGLRLVVLFAAGVVVSGVALRHGIQPNDEGLMLQAARRISDGQVPYRDFWWFYPPGQPYLLAGFDQVFGSSLIPWRVLRVLCDAGVGVLAYLLALRAASPRLALGAWAVALLAMATPSGPHPFPPTLVLCLGALLLLRAHPAWTGVLCGAAAAWRLEFGAGLGLAVVLGLALARGGEGAPPRWRDIGRFALAAVAVGVLLYAPVVLAAGLRPSWELLVRYPLLEFGDYQRLPFPLSYDGPLNTSSPGGFLSDTAENLLLFYIPLVLVIGLAASLASLAARWRRLDATEIATAVFAVVMLQYLLARTDEFHAAPLAVMVAILGTWALAKPAPDGPGRVGGTRRRSFVRRGAGLVCVAVLVFVAIVGADRRVRALTEPTTPIVSPVADGVRAGSAHDAGLNDVLGFLRERTEPGEPIYVATSRSDLVTAGHPLLYVLADRPNPTAYDIQAPGVVTSAPVQREIVEDLRREDVRYVVRYDDPVTAAPEPNRAGESSGVTILDDELARAYAPIRRFGPFVVYERRARGA